MMHQIEPFWKWRDRYIAEEDERSPFYGTSNSEFEYSQAVYNYYIHPQWNAFGSNTLYLKVLFVDYRHQFAVIEFLGEWNDCIGNDIMFLKRDVIDLMITEGINKFVLIGENVMNFHISDNSYYEEWNEDVIEEGGWIIGLNFKKYVLDEMISGDLHHYIYLHDRFSDVAWRKYQPLHLMKLLDDLIMKRIA